MKKISKEELKELYYSNNTFPLAKQMGISVRALLKLLREAEIPLKSSKSGQGKRKFKFEK
jgi:hypothetical protein